MPTHVDRERDNSLDGSSPASDRPANAGSTGTGAPNRPSHERGIDERPTGTPTSDRHATETAHQWEHEDPHHEERPAHEERPRHEEGREHRERPEHGARRGAKR
jgi:hypothetical protein